MWHGATPPPGWKLCNGQAGTPNLSGRFIVSYGNGGSSVGNYAMHNTGGIKNFRLEETNLPNHKHGASSDDGSASNSQISNHHHSGSSSSNESDSHSHTGSVTNGGVAHGHGSSSISTSDASHGHGNGSLDQKNQSHGHSLHAVGNHGHGARFVVKYNAGSGSYYTEIDGGHDGGGMGSHNVEVDAGGHCIADNQNTIWAWKH